jgi:hypothetical protein
VATTGHVANQNCFCVWTKCRGLLSRAIRKSILTFANRDRVYICHCNLKYASNTLGYVLGTQILPNSFILTKE